MAVTRRTWLYSWGLWLSLAMVLGHALAPNDTPLTPKRGSAFSSATFEVSLGAPRAATAAKLRSERQGSDDSDGPFAHGVLPATLPIAGTAGGVGFAGTPAPPAAGAFAPAAAPGEGLGARAPPFA